MKIETVVRNGVLCAVLCSVAMTSARASDIYKADVPDNLNLGSSWTGGVAPGASDIAIWDSTVVNNLSSSPGADLSWMGLQILNPAGAITIANDGNTLTLGASGIDLSQATEWLTLDSAVVLGASQTWTVTNGLKLTVGAAVSGAADLTLSGSGEIELSAADTYSGNTLINGATVEPDNASCFASGGVTNNNATLLFDVFPNGGTIKNVMTVQGTNTIDCGNTGEGVVLDGAWIGSGAVDVTNLAAGATLTFGENGNGGGNMNAFTGSIVVTDPNSAGNIRFNNGGGNNNSGNSGMIMDLGQSSVTFYSRNNGASVKFGALSGGPNTIIKQGSSSSGITTYTIGALNLDTTFAGAINDAQATSAQIALTKVGSGTFILSGNGDYSGVTTISAGTLQIGDGVTAGTGTIGVGTGDVMDNATLVLNRPDDFSVFNNISGSGITIKTNSNTVTYTGADTTSGPLDINEGAFLLQGSVTAPIFVASGATFDVSQDGAFTLNSTLSGPGAVNGPLTAGDGAAISPSIAGQAGTLAVTNDLVETGNVNNLFQLSAPGGTNDGINVVGNLTVSGVNEITPTTFDGAGVPPGTYTLITYSGTFSGSATNFVINAIGLNGTIANINNQIQLTVTSSTTLRNPTNLTWIGGPSDYWDVYTSSNWENGGTLYSFLPGDMVTFNDAGGTNTNVDIDATVSPASITVASANNYTLSGDGDIEGSTGLFKTNSGVLTILTTNSYKGPTIVDGGTLAVSDLELSGVASPIGAGPNSADNVVFNGSTLDFLGAAATTDHGMTLNSGGATFEVANAGADLTLSGILTGAGELTIPGPGLLTLGGASTYSGGTFLDAATVEPDNASCFGTGGMTNNNGVMLFDIFPNGGVIPNIITVEGTNTINCGNNGGGIVLGGALVGSGTVDVTNLVTSATLTFGESGSGGGNLSAFTGSIVVTDPNSAGNLRFNNGGGNNNSGNSAMTMDLGQSSVTFYSRNNGAPVNFGALTGGPFTVIKQGTSSSGTSTYTIGGLNTNCTYSGKIGDGGVGSGGYLGLVKVGTGTLTLNGGSTLTTNTVIVGIIPVTTIGYQADMIAYTGPTTVSNGVLALDAPAELTNSDRVTLAAPNAVLDASEMGYISNLSYTLDNGATQEVIIDSTYEVVTNQILAGVGTLNGFLQADPGSTFNVGLPTGAFNVTSNASLSGSIVMSLNGSSSSELIANGITIGSTASLLVTNIGAGLANGATFTLFNGPVSGFASIILPATDPTGTTNYVWADNLDKNGTITLSSGGVIGAAPTIHFSLSGQTLTLSWSAADLGDTLQMQTNSVSVGLGTNWVDVPGSASVTSTNIAVDPGTPTAFFRLVQ